MQSFNDVCVSWAYPARNLSSVGNEDLIKSLREEKKNRSVQSIINMIDSNMFV